MNSGNHLADQADRERDRADRCSCGGYLDSVTWCNDQNCECYKSCPTNIPMLPCYMAEEKLRCRRCGVVVESE